MATHRASATQLNEGGGHSVTLTTEHFAPTDPRIGHLVNTRWTALSVGFALVALSSHAGAQSAAARRGVRDPAATNNGSQPHRPSAEFTHDGGYFDFSYGLGGFVSWSGTEQTRRMQGVVPTDVWVGAGGTAGTTVLGVALQYQLISWLSASDPPSTATPLEDPAGLTLSALGFGFFIRHYFDAQGGWHVGGGALVNSMSTSRDDEAPFGVGVWADVGHDFWIDEQSCLGPFLRLTTHWMSVQEVESVGSARVNTLVPVVGLALRAH